MKQDRIVGLGILVVGAFLLYETFTFRVVTWEPLGMAFWPRVLLGCLAVIAVHLILRGSLDEGPFHRVESRAFVALAIGTVYVLLLDTIGYVLLTPPFLFVAALLLGRPVTSRKAVGYAFMAVVGTASMYLAFHGGLRVELPQGLLEMTG